MTEKSAKGFTGPFAEWSARVNHEARASPLELYKEGGSSHPFYNDCISECCGLMIAMDCEEFLLGKECCKQMVRNRTYKLLGEAALTDWEAVSAALAQRAGEDAQDPAWPQEGAVASIDYVTYRIRRACCPSEVAVLMLRLAVRAACLASSWYGPWESLQALQELNKVNAWTALLNALGALLGRLGPNLGKQYNAVNIVSDVLHIFYSLSERHNHVEFKPSDITPDGDLGQLVTVLFLVLDHAHCLPRMHRHQEDQEHTSLLLAPSMAMLVFKTAKARGAELPIMKFMADARFRQLCSDSLCGWLNGEHPDLGDTPETLDTDCIQRMGCIDVYCALTKHMYTVHSHLCLPWSIFCAAVPLNNVRQVISMWVHCSGDDDFHPSVGLDYPNTMVLCLRLMRMVAACHRYAMFYHRSGMLSHCLHLLRYILDASPATRPDDRGASARRLRRVPDVDVCLPFAPERGWQRGLWAAMQECVTSLGDFLGHPWRPAVLPPDEHHITGFPSQCVGTMRSALYQEESAAGRWRRYDSRVEAALDMGAAGVVESLLRLTARMPINPQYAIMTSQAPQLAHALLHHPRIWPRQETALGLLVSLRKFYQMEWVKSPWGIQHANSATMPMALLAAIVRKEARLPEHTAAFAATQLLPVIQAATDRHLAATPGQQYSPHLCKELLTMCSYLSTSSAWPVLLGHRELIMLAADMVLVTARKGVPAYRDPSPMLDQVCMHVAACDLAVADARFKNASSAPGTDVMLGLLELQQAANKSFPSTPEAEGLFTLMDFQFGRVMAASIPGSATQRYFKPLLATVEGTLGCVPDWRSTPYWRKSSFVQAWSRAKKQPLTEGTVADVLRQELVVALLEPQRGDTGPTPAEKAAAELLEARSLLLAGESGLCCNPRCTELCGRHERSLRTLRCGGGCQHGRFCSRECLKQAWPVHRRVCNKKKKSAAAQ